MFDFEKIWNEMASRKRRSLLFNILLSEDKSLYLSSALLSWRELSFKEQEIIKSWLI